MRDSKTRLLVTELFKLDKRWHRVGAVIQQRKEGETWPGGQRRARHLNSGNKGMDQVSICSPSGFSQQ